MYKTPRPLDDILLVAHFGLLSNDTITTYVMVDGKEVRSQANPFAKMRRSLQEMGEAARRVSESIAKAFENAF